MQFAFPNLRSARAPRPEARGPVGLLAPPEGERQ